MHSIFFLYKKTYGLTIRMGFYKKKKSHERQKRRTSGAHKQHKPKHNNTMLEHMEKDSLTSKVIKKTKGRTFTNNGSRPTKKTKGPQQQRRTTNQANHPRRKEEEEALSEKRGRRSTAEEKRKKKQQIRRRKRRRRMNNGSYR